MSLLVRVRNLLVPLLLASSLAPVPAAGRDIPDGLRAFYDSVVSSKSCSDPLATGFYSVEEGSHDFSYCGDHLDDFNIVYIRGKGKDTLTNMDVDCDGAYNATTDDGRCGSSTDTQSVTSFQYEVEEMNVGLKDLDANVHPYVVFGNQGSKKGFAEYDPTSDGVKGLSVVAVVCNGKLVYGIWGDYNGDDGDKSLVGEASISLATLCYGNSISGGNGHDEDDVLYIAFAGDEAVPGAAGADWAAGDPEAFEKSISGLGDRLVSRITGASERVLKRTVVFQAAFGSVAAVLLAAFI